MYQFRPHRFCCLVIEIIIDINIKPAVVNIEQTSRRQGLSNDWNEEKTGRVAYLSFHYRRWMNFALGLSGIVVSGMATKYPATAESATIHGMRLQRPGRTGRMPE